MSRRIDNLAKQQALISIYEYPNRTFKMLGLFDDKLKQEGATIAYKLGNALNSQLQPISSPSDVAKSRPHLVTKT